MKRIFLTLTFLCAILNQSAYATGFSAYLSKLYQKMGVSGGAGALNKGIGWLTTASFLGSTTFFAWTHYDYNKHINDNAEALDSHVTDDKDIQKHIHAILRDGKFPEEMIQNTRVIVGDKFASFPYSNIIMVPETFVKSMYPEKFKYDELSQVVLNSYAQRGIKRETFEQASAQYLYTENTFPAGRASILHEGGHILHEKYNDHRFSPSLILALGYGLQLVNHFVGKSLKSSLNILSCSTYNKKSLIHNIIQVGLAASKIVAYPFKKFLVNLGSNIPLRYNEERADSEAIKRGNTKDLEYRAQEFESLHQVEQALLSYKIKKKAGVDCSKYPLFLSCLARIYQTVTFDPIHPSPHSRAQKIRQELERRKVEELQKNMKNL